MVDIWVLKSTQLRRVRANIIVDYHSNKTLKIKHLQNSTVCFTRKWGISGKLKQFQKLAIKIQISKFKT